MNVLFYTEFEENGREYYPWDSLTRQTVDLFYNYNLKAKD
jgi:hypothetical protein